MALRFDTIKDLDAAKLAWEELTPKVTLYDDWDFRNAFHSYHTKELFFIAGYDDVALIGLLPLQYNNDLGQLEFWGGSYMEDNRVFCKAGFESAIPAFYDYVKTLGKPLVLQYIRGDDAFTAALPVEDNKFILPLTFTTIDEYVDQIFSGETKKKLVKRLKKIEELGVTVETNHFSDIELLFDWNIAAFPDSAFIERPFHKEIFRDLLKPHATFKPRLLTYSVGGVKQAVTMGLIYNETSYASVNRGIDPAADKNLREYIQLKKIADALGEGCTVFDAFVGDYGWKERWAAKNTTTSVYL